ncbi:uncharacterized protein LOC114580895 [Dendrobium catenatum]|uniref:uncharacterized protein LOC114580895 n=1 Tax=Dendrobium catenatum TaxID=906689 RepID=UPI00109F2078|nr:uncharacterized protein LOC114580895 [Dendrobium catenatum]
MEKLSSVPCSDFSNNPVNQSVIGGTGLKEAVVKNSEGVKLNVVNAWKKTQHIKLNYDMDSTPVTDDGIAVIMNCKSENVNSQVLKNSLVIKVLGNNIPFPVCSRELRRQWARFSNFHLTTLGLDWILCSFSKSEVVEEVLEGSPWFIGGNIIGLDKWSPNFSPEALKGLTALIWIRLPCLPLHCWDEQNICRIASKIGIPIYLDGNSFKWGKREYARVCVCMDLDKKVPKGIWIEGLHGHLKSKCSLINNASSRTVAEVFKVNGKITDQERDSFNKTIGLEENKSTEVLLNNCFSILEEDLHNNDLDEPKDKGSNA